MPAKTYNNKVHLGSGRGSDESKMSKRQVMVENTMDCLLHDAKAIHAVLHSSTAKSNGSLYISPYKLLFSEFYSIYLTMFGYLTIY